MFPVHDRHPVPQRWGEPLLFGPGSIHVAHTADESVAIAELHAAVDHYVAIAKHLLASRLKPDATYGWPSVPLYNPVPLSPYLRPTLLSLFFLILTSPTTLPTHLSPS